MSPDVDDYIYLRTKKYNTSNTGTQALKKKVRCWSPVHSLGYVYTALKQSSYT